MAFAYRWYIIGTVVIVIVAIALISYFRMRSNKSADIDQKIIEQNKEHLDAEVAEKFDDTEYRQTTLDSDDSGSDSEPVMLKSNKKSGSNRGSKIQSLTSTGCQDKKKHRSIIPVDQAVQSRVSESSPAPKRKRSKSEDTEAKLDPYSHTRTTFVGEDPFKRPEPFNFLCCDTGLPSGVQLLSRSEGLPHGL